MTAEIWVVGRSPGTSAALLEHMADRVLAQWEAAGIIEQGKGLRRTLALVFLDDELKSVEGVGVVCAVAFMRGALRPKWTAETHREVSERFLRDMITGEQLAAATVLGLDPKEWQTLCATDPIRLSIGNEDIFFSNVYPACDVRRAALRRRHGHSSAQPIASELRFCYNAVERVRAGWGAFWSALRCGQMVARPSCAGTCAETTSVGAVSSARGMRLAPAPFGSHQQQEELNTQVEELLAAQRVEAPARIESHQQQEELNTQVEEVLAAQRAEAHRQLQELKTHVEEAHQQQVELKAQVEEVLAALRVEASARMETHRQLEEVKTQGEEVLAAQRVEAHQQQVELKAHFEEVRAALRVEASARMEERRQLEELKTQGKELLAAQRVEAVEAHRQQEELKAQVEDVLAALRVEAAARMESHHQQEELKVQLEKVLAAQRVEAQSLQERPCSSACFQPAVEEIDVPASAGKAAYKEIRMMCPGVYEEHIRIKLLPNGVRVQIEQDGACADYSRTFYHSEDDEEESRFELCPTECRLDHGILILRMKRTKSTELKFYSVGGQFRLLPWKECEGADHREDAQASSHSTVSSHERADIVDGSSSGSVESWKLVSASGSLNSLMGSALSAPPADLYTHRCLLHDCGLLGENGAVISGAELKRGVRLPSLKAEDDGTLTPGVTLVRAIRWYDMPMDCDVANISLLCEVGGPVSMCIPTSHSVLTCTPSLHGGAWAAKAAGDVKCNCNRLPLFGMGASESPYLSQVQKSERTIVTCRVVSLELEDASCAVLLRVGDGTFAAVFGDPGMEPVDIVIRHGFLDVARAGIAASSHSDPIHTKEAAKLYGRINPPHDAGCSAWCKFYFGQGHCKKGKLCSMCHNVEHFDDSVEETRRRRRQRRVQKGR